MKSPLTDAGNAELFAEQNDFWFRYVHGPDFWVCWDHKRWARDDRRAVYSYALATVRGIHEQAMAEGLSTAEVKEISRHAIRSERRDRLEAMLALARSHIRLARVAGDFDKDPWLLNTPTGTLDLRTGELREHKREDMLSKLTGVGYLRNAPCPTWERHLRCVLPSAELRAFLQRAAGYSLTGDVSGHALFFLHGSGRNGKSTTLKALRAVWGDYAGSAPFDMLLMTRGEQHPTALAELAGRRLVVAVEAGQGRALNEPLVKWLVGGDRLTARRMRQDFAEFEPTHKLWLGANHRPRIRGTDEAIWRRVKLIPFTVQIAEADVDPHLGDKLLAEGPGILRWALEGCLAWQRDGLGVPPEVVAAVSDYRQAEDRLGDFLEERCILAPEASVPRADLYRAYREYADATSGERPMTAREVAEALRERGITDGATRRGVRTWTGIALQGAAGADGVHHLPHEDSSRAHETLNLKLPHPSCTPAPQRPNGGGEPLPPEAIWSPEELEKARRQTGEPAVGDEPRGRTP